MKKINIARKLNEKDLFAQLGGQNKLIAMVGANNFARVSDSEVSFRFKGSKIANWVKYTLTSADLYDVEYGKIRGHSFKVVKTSKGLYNDMIKNDFEQTVKLYLSL